MFSTILEAGWFLFLYQKKVQSSLYLVDLVQFIFENPNSSKVEVEK